MLNEKKYFKVDRIKWGDEDTSRKIRQEQQPQLQKRNYREE
jgi:hypothetical protein